MNNTFVRTMLLWMLVFLGALLLLELVSSDRFRTVEIPFSQFYTYV